jgi:two-component system, response regulator
MKNRTPINILMADDDADDRILMKEAFAEIKLLSQIHFVDDGEKLMQYPYKRRTFMSFPTFGPGMILLDLNMPKIDGREAGKIVTSDKDLKRIPVVIYTTPKSEDDVIATYDLGVNSFICKPVEYDQLAEIAREISNYWFRIVTLPLQ